MKNRITLLGSLILIIIMVAFTGNTTAETTCQHDFVWQNDGANTHWKKCFKCEMITNKGPHVSDEVGGYDDHNHWKVCKDCGAKYGEKAHEKGKDWTPSTRLVLYHVKKCTGCAFEFESEQHSYEWKKVDNDYHDEVCKVCGKAKNQRIEHELEDEVTTSGIDRHTFKCKICKAEIEELHDESMMIWEEHGSGHRYKCKICGKVLDEQPHNFEDLWGFDDIYHWQKCKTCGAENIKGKVKHTPGNDWYETGNKHYKICKDCDKQLLLEEHEDKDNDGICDTCGLTGLAAEGKDPLTVAWVQEHCDKGCTDYRYTDGTAYKCWVICEGGHTKWECGDHEGGEPTCKENKYCPRCGRYYWLEHNYIDGVCTECGAVQPDNPIPTAAPTATPTTTPTTTPTATPTATPTTTPTATPTTVPTTTPTSIPTSTENWEKDVYYHWQDGGEKGLHKPQPATCTKPISCMCGAYIGKPKGHQYDSNDICTVCGASKDNEGNPPVEKNVPFADVNPGSWYYDNGAVKFVTDNGYIEPLSTNNFGPDIDMTRGKFIKMLYIIEGKPSILGYPSEDLNITEEYSDISGDKTTVNAIIWGRKNGIMSGMGNGKFGTEEGVSRQQMAVALKRYVEYRGEGTSQRADITKFSDYSDVYDWAEEAFKWAVAKGIISGDSNNMLRPQANATRAQVATMIMKYLTK